MAYKIYLDKMLLPIAPEKLEIKVTNQNETINLINDGEYGILKQPGLSEISFEALLPNVQYPFAIYSNGFVKASEFLAELKSLKTSGEPFMFKVMRASPSGSAFYDTNMKVSLESYTIKENVSYGMDTVVSISLKEYQSCATKVYSQATADDGTVTVTAESERETDSSVISIGSSVILNGTLYSSSFGDGAGSTKSNYQCKVNIINESGTYPYHLATTDGSWLGWASADSIERC